MPRNVPAYMPLNLFPSCWHPTSWVSESRAASRQLSMPAVIAVQVLRCKNDRFSSTWSAADGFRGHKLAYTLRLHQNDCKFGDCSLRCKVIHISNKHRLIAKRAQTRSHQPRIGVVHHSRCIRLQMFRCLYSKLTHCVSFNFYLFSTATYARGVHQLMHRIYNPTYSVC